MSAQDEPDKLNGPSANKPDANEPERLPDGAMQRFEAQLASLSPRAAHFDRDRLMFLAGQASVSSAVTEPAHRGWAWSAAFSAMSALAAGLLLTLVLRAQPPEVVRIVQVPAEGVRAVDESGADRQNDRLSPSNERVAAQSAPSRPEVFPDKAAPGRPYVELRDRVLAM
ncbi:MAG TPA: hypothetical protein VGX78_09840, partial [Pirellulales bacterium]|nr:hypothetical protein [Pirellulales bacterium]